MKKPNVVRSNYFRLSPDANGTTSLTLWLSEEPEYIFNEFRMVIKLKWNCWAEGICSPIILMSQHKRNSDRDCLGLYYFCSCLRLLHSLLLVFLPFGKCTPPSPSKASLPAGVRSDFSFSMKLFLIIRHILLWKLMMLFRHPKLSYMFHAAILSLWQYYMQCGLNRLTLFPECIGRRYVENMSDIHFCSTFLRTYYE